MSLLGLNPYPNPNPNPNQATMSLLGALSCSRLRVPLPGLAELRAAGPLIVLCMIRVRAIANPNPNPNPNQAAYCAVHG